MEAAGCLVKKPIIIVKNELKRVEMWERINKVIIQNAVAFMVILGCLAVVFIACFKTIPAENKELINAYFNMCLVEVIGWLFTQSKKVN